MEVNIDKEAIERAVVSAILDSAIGEKIRLAVEKLLKPEGYGKPSPIEEAVEKVIKETAIRFINTNHAEQIKKAVQERLTDETVNKFVDRFWQQVFRI